MESGVNEYRGIPVEDAALELFMQYLYSYTMYDEPSTGAVSPALSRFFATCTEEIPALVHWVRWLRMAHESDEGLFTFEPEFIDRLTEAMIASMAVDADVADLMRRAAQGDPEHD